MCRPYGAVLFKKIFSHRFAVGYVVSSLTGLDWDWRYGCLPTGRLVFPGAGSGFATALSAEEKDTPFAAQRMGHRP